MFHVPEGFRVAGVPTTENGRFRVPVARDSKARPTLWALVQASNGFGWEHVSVSIPGVRRCPTWDEMCAVKALFWDDEDTTMQLHVPKSSNINRMEFCLHIWRPMQQEIPRPLDFMV